MTCKSDCTLPDELLDQIAEQVPHALPELIRTIIMTTGTFTKDAKGEAVRDGVPPIELVNGEKLLDMLEELGLGLRPVTSYEVDVDFFEEFMA